MAPSSPTRGAASSSATLADAASWYCAIVILALILIGSIRGNSLADEPHDYDHVMRPGNQLLNRRPCDEIYVVGEGETLHTISDKCGDPFIVERNPHIHDPDDVFPGLVIKIISPSTPRKLLRQSYAYIYINSIHIVCCQLIIEKKKSNSFFFPCLFGYEFCVYHRNNNFLMESKKIFCTFLFSTFFVYTAATV